MILKCIESFDESFKVGKFYICFGINFNEDRQITQVSLRRDSDGTPVLMKISQFDIIDSEIPIGWTISIIKHNDRVNTYIEPKEFSGDFWDLYHNGDFSSDKTFEEVYLKLKNTYPDYI